MPSVSVIIPAYNCAAYIGETVHSVIAQTVPAHEIIVVNDGSPDTPALHAALRPYLGAIRLVERPNGGPAAARNTGIDAATGDVLAFLDGDDIWEPRCLERLGAVLDAEPDVTLVFSDGILFGRPDNEGRLYTSENPTSSEPTLAEILAGTSRLLTSSVLVRADWVRRVGGFDIRYRVIEDLHLWLRLAHAGAKIRHVPEPLMRRRLLPDSLSANHQNTAKRYIPMLEDFGREFTLGAAEREALDGALARARLDLLLYEGKTALLAGDYQAARRAFDAAAAQGRLKHRMVRAAAFAAPALLRRVLDLRDRREAQAILGPT